MARAMQRRCCWPPDSPEPGFSRRSLTSFQRLAPRSERSGERTLYDDAAAADVRDIVEAVTERRVSYLTGLLEASGVPGREARRRAVIVVSAVIGYQQLVSSGWDAAADPRPLVETLFALATAPV